VNIDNRITNLPVRLLVCDLNRIIAESRQTPFLIQVSGNKRVIREAGSVYKVYLNRRKKPQGQYAKAKYMSGLKPSNN
jgi:hypothetical protein